MSQRFEQWKGSAGKGDDDRSNNIKRSRSPLWKIVKLDSGVSLDPEEAKKCIDIAAVLISMFISMRKIEGDEVEETLNTANQWIRKYHTPKRNL